MVYCYCLVLSYLVPYPFWLLCWMLSIAAAAVVVAAAAASPDLYIGLGLVNE
jgi:hypothetical protein